MLVEGPLNALKRSMVSFARPRKFAPDNLLGGGTGFANSGRTQPTEGLGDGTPLPMSGMGAGAPGGMGHRPHQNGGGRGGYMSGDAAGYGSQRSASGYGMDPLTQASYSLSLSDSQPQTQGYASANSQGYSQASQPAFSSQQSFTDSQGGGQFALSSQDFALTSSQEDLYRTLRAQSRTRPARHAPGRAKRCAHAPTTALTLSSCDCACVAPVLAGFGADQTVGW